jgi:hypothetical protein
MNEGISAFEDKGIPPEQLAAEDAWRGIRGYQYEPFDGAWDSVLYGSGQEKEEWWIAPEHVYGIEQCVKSWHYIHTIASICQISKFYSRRTHDMRACGLPGANRGGIISRGRPDVGRNSA